MLLRTTRVRVRPGQVDEFARRWQAIIAPHVPEAPGLRSAYLCANHDSNTIMAVQVWERAPGEAAHADHGRQPFRDQVRDLLADSEPVIEEYEILAQGQGR